MSVSAQQKQQRYRTRLERLYLVFAVAWFVAAFHVRTSLEARVLVIVLLAGLAIYCVGIVWLGDELYVITQIRKVARALVAKRRG